jgi:putative transposase
MRKSKFTETQIVSILKQADAGVPVKDLCRQAGISVATYYQWKSKFGGMEASELKRVRELEEENSRLKRLYADLALENLWKPIDCRCVGPAPASGCRARLGTPRRWIGRCATPN